jgi:hypothetical protein
MESKGEMRIKVARGLLFWSSLCKIVIFFPESDDLVWVSTPRWRDVLEEVKLSEGWGVRVRVYQKDHRLDIIGDPQIDTNV